MDSETTTTNGKKLMIVDDDADMRTLLAEYFRRLGFEVTEKENGPSALQAATATRFDCFIFDVAMPEMTGLELLKKLRERDVTTPTLFLTAHDMLDDRVAAVLDLDAGDAVEHVVVCDQDVVAHADVDGRVGDARDHVVLDDAVLARERSCADRRVDRRRDRR